MKSRGLDDLLAQADFLRRLARGLVRDEQEAEDLVQDTWAAALEHPPRDPSTPRAWLATVARHLASNARRAERRRRDREQLTAREEAEAESTEAAQRLELVALVSELAARLREPYRGVIYLRYHEGLAPKEIAVRRRVPVETVKTQLARAREQLRRGLDERTGSRKTWMPGLAALAMPRLALDGVATHLVGLGGLLFMKKLILAAAALVLAFVTWRGLGEGMPALPMEGMGAQTPSALDPAQIAVVPPPLEAQRRSMDPVSAPLHAEADGMERQGLILSGTVRLLDEWGGEHVPPDGELGLSVMEPRGRTVRRGDLHLAHVRKGDWSVEIKEPFGPELRFTSLTLEGKPAFVEFPEGVIAIPADGRIDVRARIKMPVVLRVVDASSGAPLEGIRIVDDGESWTGHPGLDLSKLLAADLRSPIALSRDFGDRISPRSRSKDAHLLVGVEGYTWERVSLDFDLGGERIVALQAAGDLEVNVRGLEPGSPVRLLLHLGSGELPHARILLERDGALLVRGLSPGRVVVRAELGWDLAVQTRLAEAMAEITAGRMSSVTLELGPPPHLRRASIRGRVLVPKDWGMGAGVLRRVTLELLDPPLGEVEPVRSFSFELPPLEVEGCDAFDWSFEDVQVGRHVLAIGEPDFKAVLEVPPGGIQGFDMRVPRPADYLVNVVDAATGAPIEDAFTYWSQWLPDDLEYSPQVIHAKEGGLWRFRAPGAIRLSTGAPRYESIHQRLDPGAASRVVTVRLERACDCGLLLELRDGVARVPIPSGWWGAIEAEGAGGRHPLSSLDTFHAVWSVPSPGIYTLQLPRISGYLQPAPLQLEVREGQQTRHVLQLQREHSGR